MIQKILKTGMLLLLTLINVNQVYAESILDNYKKGIVYTREKLDSVTQRIKESDKVRSILKVSEDSAEYLDSKIDSRPDLTTDELHELIDQIDDLIFQLKDNAENKSRQYLSQTKSYTHDKIMNMNEELDGFNEYINDYLLETTNSKKKQRPSLNIVPEKISHHIIPKNIYFRNILLFLYL